MKSKVTNNSKAEQGVWTDEGLQFIAPGKTRTLTIADDYIERAKSLPFLKVADVVEEAPVVTPAAPAAPAAAVRGRPRGR